MKIKTKLVTVSAFLLMIVFMINCTPAAVQNTVPANPKPAAAAPDVKPVEIPKANTAVQTSPKPSVPENTGISTPKYQVFCRDGVCTFINGKSYSIDYPETWKLDTTLSQDLSVVKLAHKEAKAEMTITKAGPIGPTTLSEVVNAYIAKQRAASDLSFYNVSSEAMKGAWDWHVEYYVQSTWIWYTRVYFRSTDTCLYSLTAFCDQNAYDAYILKKDYDKIINSFKVLQ
jgi:hypothetical protein